MKVMTLGLCPRFEACTNLLRPTIGVACDSYVDASQPLLLISSGSIRQEGEECRASNSCIVKSQMYPMHSLPRAASIVRCVGEDVGTGHLDIHCSPLVSRYHSITVDGHPVFSISYFLFLRDAIMRHGWTSISPTVVGLLATLGP